MKCEIAIIILNFIHPNFRNHFVSELLLQIFHVTTTRFVKVSEISVPLKHHILYSHGYPWLGFE